MKKVLILLSVVFSAFAAAFLPTQASAIDINHCVNQSGECDVCQYCDPGNGSDPGNCPSICNNQQPNPEKETDLILRIGHILNTVFLWSGIIATIVIVISGIYFMTSRGNPQTVEKAKSALIYSIVGLIIVLCAAAITSFVIKALK